MRADIEQEYVAYLRACLPRWHRMAYLMCGDADRAEDIVQSTALALYVHWTRVRAADNVDAYVHRVLTRQYLDTKRLAWSRVLLTVAVPDRPAPAETELEQRDELSSALAKLSRGQRAALVLRFYCDLSVEQTAAAMGCSTGTVKSQTARGLATLRDLLSGKEIGADRARA